MIERQMRPLKDVTENLLSATKGFETAVQGLDESYEMIEQLVDYEELRSENERLKKQLAKR